MADKHRPDDSLVTRLRQIDHYITPRDAAYLLGSDRETVYDMLHQQPGLGHLVGHRWKVDPRKLADWLELRG
jgi:hypothetical protein